MPHVTTVSAAKTMHLGCLCLTVSAFSKATLAAYFLGASSFLIVSSMSAASDKKFSRPICLRRSLRLGDPDAKTNSRPSGGKNSFFPFSTKLYGILYLNLNVMRPLVKS